MLIYNSYTMGGFVQKIKQIFAVIRAKNIRSKLVGILKKLNPSGKSVYHDKIDLSAASSNEQKAEFKNNILAIIKSTNCECEKLLSYIQAAGTDVHYLANAQKALAPIKEEPGLISEQKGFEAVYLSFITERRFRLYTKPMFVIDKNFVDKYSILQNFYKWYSLKSGLPGFEYGIQKKLKQYLRSSGQQVRGLNLDEVEELQQALLREQEATDFVLDYAKEMEGSQKVVEKLKNNGSAEV